jgi:hypothetical protein
MGAACCTVSAKSEGPNSIIADGPRAKILPAVGTLLSSPQVDNKKKNTDVQPCSKDTISIQVTMLGGEVFAFDLPPSATVSDVKALINEKLGHRTWNQKLLSESTALTDSLKSLGIDSSASLKSLGIADNFVLKLSIDREPIGQSYLEQPNGEKLRINRHDRFGGQFAPAALLKQFELQSWQAACASSVGRDKNWNDNAWGNIEGGILDFFWTTRSDGCRYEYWSVWSAPETGCLVRVDADKMVAIARENCNGFDLFDEFVSEYESNDAFRNVIQELRKEGWPCFNAESKIQRSQINTENDTMAPDMFMLRDDPFSMLRDDPFFMLGGQIFSEMWDKELEALARQHRMS